MSSHGSKQSGKGYRLLWWCRNYCTLRLLLRVLRLFQQAFRPLGVQCWNLAFPQSLIPVLLRSQRLHWMLRALSEDTSLLSTLELATLLLIITCSALLVRGVFLILLIIIDGCKRNNQNSQKEKQQYFNRGATSLFFVFLAEREYCRLFRFSSSPNLRDQGSPLLRLRFFIHSGSSYKWFMLIVAHFRNFA